jgi:Flp pilus assembly protein TadG
MPRGSGSGLAKLARAREGVAAVEMAMLLPAFLTVLLGMVEFGRLFWTQSALQFAVEAAARCASVNTTTCGSASATQTYAASQAFGLTIPSTDFTVSTPSCGNEVSIAYSFGFVVPKLFPWTITLNAQSCHP